ncbi:MAG: hypothetical protein ABSG60_14550 [Terracidiphilus sp.]|jgi:hypothetical protein
MLERPPQPVLIHTEHIAQQVTQDCTINPVGVQTGGAAKLWQQTAPAGAVTPQSGQSPFGFRPPATMLESSLPQAPGTITLPPAIISVYEFAVMQQQAKMSGPLPR